MIQQTADEFVRDMNKLADTIGNDLTAPLEKCKPRLLESFNENFNSQSSAGNPWPPRKDEGFAHPLLNLSGHLKAAATGQGAGHVERIINEGDRTSIELGVDKTAEGGGLPGAAVHNYGAVIRPVNKQYLSWINSKGERVFAKQVTIPQREYLIADEQAIDDCADIMADELLKGFA